MTEIYWYISVVSSGFIGLLVLLNIIGIDLDEVDIGLDFFSFNSFIAFFCVGGWVGYFANHMTDFDQWIVLALSILFGLVTYVGSVLILKKMKSWESSGNIDINNAVGKVGTVYLGIPAKGEGEGEVEVLVQGRLKIFPATAQKEGIQTGDKVLVFDVSDNKLIVTPYTEN